MINTSRLLVQPVAYEFAQAWADNGLPWPRPATDVFQESVKDYLESPWIRSGIHIDLTDQFWSTVEPVTISSSDLCATQKKLLKKPFHATLGSGVARSGEDTNGESRSLPWVVFWKDRPWIVDGHHRAAVAVLENEPLQVRAIYL